MEDVAHIETVPGSERGFGFVFAGLFGIIGLLPLLQGAQPRWWALGIAVALSLVALLRPGVLARPNAWWFRLGMLLGAVVAPVVMLLVYLVAVVPLGLLRRLLGKDSLDSRFDSTAISYWKARQKAPQPLDRQF